MGLSLGLRGRSRKLVRDVSKLVRSLRFSPVGFSADVVGFGAEVVGFSADRKVFPGWIECGRVWI